MRPACGGARLTAGRSSLVYPLRLKGPKPTPLVVMLMSLVYCLINGYLQAGGPGAHRTARG